MATKTLAVPSDDYIKNNGYPKTKAEALNLNFNRFVPEDGELRIIRQYGSKKFPNGSIEKYSSRKTNSGGGKGGSRELNEKASTPPQTKAQVKAFGKAMSNANKQGLEGDHDIPVGRSGKAVRGMSFARRVQYWNRLQKVGQYTGNQEQNITPRTREINNGRNAEFNRLDNAINKLNKSKPDPFGFNKKDNGNSNGKVKVINYSKANGRVIASGPIQTNNGKPYVDMGINMDQLAPLSRSHIIPGGRVAPIDYI